MKTAIFDFVKRKDRSKKCAQKPGALDFGVSNIRPNRPAASMIGGCHD
jgi:hypothetical protein